MSRRVGEIFQSIISTFCSERGVWEWVRRRSGSEGRGRGWRRAGRALTVSISSVGSVEAEFGAVCLGSWVFVVGEGVCGLVSEGPAGATGWSEGCFGGLGGGGVEQ